MSSGKNPTVSVILFGVFGVLSISSLFYFYFYWTRGSSIKAIKASPPPDNDKATTKDQTPVNKVEDIIVEDVEDDEDDEEDDGDDDEGEEDEVGEKEEEKKDDEMEALRLQYDNANRLAMKYISGQAYDRAIEKLTEALELANVLPNASKDILTLYNNRSAMYEKNGNFDKALTDISVILTVEFTHLKARVSLFIYTVLL